MITQFPSFLTPNTKACVSCLTAIIEMRNIFCYQFGHINFYPKTELVPLHFQLL